MTLRAKMSRGPSRRAFLAIAASALAAPTVLRAGALEGRRISFLIGNEGSGGYERYARTFAKHFALALPDARLTVEVVPTADGRLAAKRINDADSGELTIGLFESALLYSEIEADSLAPISLAGFSWIGKLAVDERVLIASRKSGIESVEELSRRPEPAIFTASTIVSRSASECFLLNAMLGLQIKPVPGYDGGQRALAMISGEGQVVVGSYPSQVQLLEQGEAVTLLRLNEVPAPSVPLSVPLLRDLADARYGPLIDMMELSSNLGRWIAAPPSIATEDLTVLRAAFDRVVESPDFLSDAEAQELAIEPLGGHAVQETLATLLNRKKELRASFSAALSCGRQRAQGVRSC